MANKLNSNYLIIIIVQLLLTLYHLRRSNTTSLLMPMIVATCIMAIATTVQIKYKQWYYHCLYEYYMWSNKLEAITPNSKPEMQNKSCAFSSTTNFIKSIGNTIAIYCPKGTILYKVGVWNIILLINIYIVAAALYQTPSEVLVMNDLATKYVPRNKRWNIFKRVTNGATKTLAIAMAPVINWIESSQSKKAKARELRRRIVIAKTQQTTKVYRRRPRNLVAMAALLTMSIEKSKPQQCMANFDTDAKPIGIDNRCSACISHDIKDFIGPLQETNRTIKGFGGVRHKSNIMMGTIKWKWCDNQGRTHKHIIPNSYYVPDGRVRLLSPQHWAKEQNKHSRSTTGETTNAYECKLFWGRDSQYELSVPLSKDTNVATFELAPGYKNFDIYCKEAAIITSKEDDNPITIDGETDDEEGEPPAKAAIKPQHERDWSSTASPYNSDFSLNGPLLPPTRGEPTPTTMSIPAREMLHLHYRLGHMPISKMRVLAEQGVLPKAFTKCETPLCTACLYAKQTRRPWRQKPVKSPPMEQHKLEPGEVVSVDQMVSPTLGLVAQMTGTLTTQRYKYATIYVDQASRLGYTFLQKTATSEETIKGKIAFELYCLSQGVKVKAYHADNGVFRANAWVNHCNQNNQRLTFAAVGAHHQNGVAERRIREIQNLARTMLIHAAKRWNKCITANLWPYALRQASEVINNSPNMQDKRRRTPNEIFTKTKVAINIKHFQTFGCPVYVLESELQDLKPYHKWKERSKVGIYLGMSPMHGKNVALVLNRTTGLVSPQFHVKFDSLFHSVEQDKYDSQWQIKSGLTTAKEEQQKEASQKSKPKTGNKRMREKSPNSKRVRPTIPPQEGEIAGLEGERSRTQKGSDHTTDQIKHPQKIYGKLQHKSSNDSSANKMRNRLKTSEYKRQTRNSLKTQYGSTAMAKAVVLGPENPVRVQQPNLIEVMITEISRNTKGDIEGEILSLEALFPDHQQQYQDLVMEHDPLYAYKATTDPDTMYLHEAMREPDWKHFQEAMTKEVEDQMSNGNYSIVKKSQVPKGKIILPAVWQMKRKRDIKTRQVKKYKARLNLDGSKQRKGVHYDQTYAPVTSWKFIRLLLILIVKYNWHSKQIDYVLAFPQAPIERELYMKIPKGFEIESTPGDKDEYVLKVHRNVYGQCQASRVWYQYLKNKLVKELKFHQSKVDECIFYRGKTIYMLYTDDSILAGPCQKEIDQVVIDLKRAGLNVTDEGDIQDFLGVNITKQKDGHIKLTQPHLVDQILKDLNMSNDNVKTKSTPAMVSKLLKRDEDGIDFDKSFHYRSVIGKLHYLEKGTRSDIAYITHQCARFAEKPKESHAKAIRWLARYLKGTRDKGLIIKPQPNKGLEVYVDADFSGNWDPKAPEMDKDTARSRHGYIITFEGCPIIWKSQMQTEICLSSTESEYIGLSYALREVIPIMEVIKEMNKLKLAFTNVVPKIHCKVFEDNSGALEMAKNYKYRPRTKHLNVKYHHFRDYVERGEITIHKIDTSNQLADYLTKPVSQEILEHLRLKVMGW